MTAKDFSESIQYDIQSYDEGGFLGIDTALLAEKLKEFAKFHVEVALKSVSDKFKGGIDDDAHEEIFSSYPLDNIK